MPKPEAAEFEWYDYRSINARNALWSIVSGPRSIGKTFGAKRDAVKRFLKTGEQTMWVRRTLTELTPAKQGFFDSIAPDYPGFEFRVDGTVGQIRTDGDDWQTIIRFAAVSLGSQLKGTEFPLVTRIVYDEAFIEEGGAYLSEEVSRLRGMWVTVNRSRTSSGGKAQVKVTILGNARDLDNPYFLEWDFDGLSEWQKGRETKGDVVLHLIDASRYERRVTKTIYGNVLGTVDTDYAEGKYFKPDGGYVVDKRPPESRPFATLVTTRGTFGLWLMPDYTKMFVTVGPLASQDVPVVAIELAAVRPGVVLAEPGRFIRNEIRHHYRRGSCFLVTQSAMAARQALAR